MNTQLPIPAHFNPHHVGEVWRVPYQERVAEAQAWAKQHHLTPANQDQIRIGLLLIDVQNTFCIPGFELFVGGKSGRDAIDDNVRLCEFIYRHLGIITNIAATIDTHTAMQIFHPLFWVNEIGEHPPVMTNISMADIEKGVWKINPAVASQLPQKDEKWLNHYALHYAKMLTLDSKYPLIIWPYHSILGGIGHALVSAVEEACWFHNIARQSQTHFEMKGSHPLSENYSVLQPEVLIDQDNQPIAENNKSFLEKMLAFDRLIIAGQAKSHCVAWTVEHLLNEIQVRDSKLAQKVYLLEDCTSPVVVPGTVDFTEQADAAFQQFAGAGMHLIQSTELIDW